ncbi:MAG: hypothetical protein WC394_05440, partial [Candidatus Omnitrophota bacterium]
MLYAKVVLGLPIDVAFDYSLPLTFQENISFGSRVLVNFCNRKLVGYVVGLVNNSSVKNIKPILNLIDEKPILNKSMLILAKKISDYYASSLGEAIETMLPEEIRKGKAARGRSPSEISGDSLQGDRPTRMSPVLLHDLDPERRWSIYIDEVKKT